MPPTILSPQEGEHGQNCAHQRASHDGGLRTKSTERLGAFTNEADGIDGKGGPPMSPDFTDAVLAPAECKAPTPRFCSRPPDMGTFGAGMTWVRSHISLP
jgi:hypothetical protein